MLGNSFEWNSPERDGHGVPRAKKKKAIRRGRVVLQYCRAMARSHQQKKGKKKYSSFFGIKRSPSRLWSHSVTVSTKGTCYIDMLIQMPGCIDYYCNKKTALSGRKPVSGWSAYHTVLVATPLLSEKTLPRIQLLSPYLRTSLGKNQSC